MAAEPEVMQPIEQSADAGIPASPGALAAPGAKVVEDGPIQEQLVAWSNEFGTDPLTILKENNITNSSDIYPGQMLTIPSGGAAAETSEEDGLLSQLTDMVSSSWDDITGGDSADPVTGGEAEIPGEEPGAVPDQDAEFEGTTGIDIDGENLTIGPEGTGTALDPGAKPEPEPLVITEAMSSSDLGSPTTVEDENILNLEAKPAIAEGSIAAVSTPSAVAKTVSDIEPTENELATLISTLTPTSAGAAEIYDGVIANLKGIKFDNTEDAKELYQQLSEDAEKETKKIDDAIAEIAEEKIKPTFSGWNKFMAILGAAMGAYGSAMTGTPNYALQIMNKAIDADQEQFLASKEMRTKTLLQQRQAVLQRRGELLQLGLNEADKMLKVAQLQQDNELQIANVQGIIDGLKNEATEIDNKNKLAIIEIYTAKVAAQRLASAAQTKDQRERSVNSIEVTNGDGEAVVIPGYLAPTVKAAGEQVLIREQSIKINTLLTSMHDLYTNENNWLPGVINESAVKLEQDQKELLLLVKNINKMGANFTVPEIEMITATIPTTDISGKLTTGLIKKKKLRNKYISDQKATMESFGFTKMPNVANEKKKAKGQTTIYKAP
jgi:hypothetical protein